MANDVATLTIEASAARAGVSGGTIRNLIRAGRLPIIRFSARNVRIPADALEAFLAEAPARRAAPAARPCTAR
jgi:excisionase family DNA binding protein